jgi:acetyltransferase
MLTARSVVVVGASQDPERIGGRPLRFLKAHGFPGTLYVVNPRRKEIDGVTSYPDVRDLPEPVDLAVVCLPAAQCPDVLEACAERGIGAAVLFSGGFSEAGREGRAFEERVVRTARRAGITVLGPNCVGFVNIAARLPATFAAPLATVPESTVGDIAFVAQSGAFGTFLYDWAQHRGLGVSHFVSVGNEAETSLGRVATSLLHDPTVHSLGLHIEGVRDGRALLEAVSLARDVGKPVTVLKTGRSDAGQRAALSHTGALAGSDAVFTDVLDQHGALCVSDPQEMLDLLEVFHDADVHGWHSGSAGTGRVGIVSTSGGMGVWVADLLSDFGVDVVDFGSETQERLEALLPEYGSPHNPVDMTGQIVHEPELVPGSVAAVLGDESVDVVILVLAYQVMNGPWIAQRLVEEAKLATEQGKLLFVGWILAEDEPIEILRQGGVTAFSDPGDIVRAVGRFLQRSGRDLPTSDADDAAQAVLLDRRPGDHEGPIVHTEENSKRLLRTAGFRTPDGATVSDLDDARRAAERVGYPVVLKGQADGVSHKAANGLVVLGLDSPAALGEAFASLSARLADIGMPTRVLVERQLPSGPEFILGGQRDAQLGPVVMFGAGGGEAEQESDVHFMSAPVSLGEARHLVSRTKRGAAAAAGSGGAHRLDALAREVVRMSRLIYDNANWVASAEINPLVLAPDGGAVALDGLLVEQGAASDDPAAP